MTNQNIAWPPEWAEQDAVMISWPHAATDWDYMLPQVTACYLDIARAISQAEPLLVVTPHAAETQQLIDRELGHTPHPITCLGCPTNDTWIRDYGAITVLRGGMPEPIDFKFNAWGMKYASNHDNQVNRNLDLAETFARPLANRQGFVLEGGSIESDGNGTVLTTSMCLLTPNRNGQLGKQEIEAELKARLGARKVLWLDHGQLPGDDTDGHIDTIARFAPNRTILFAGGAMADRDNPELAAMRQELQAMTDADGNPYNLVEVPLPAPVIDEDDQRQLPATYLNFLVVNGRVIVPTYGQPMPDELALRIMRMAWPQHEVVGVDCSALVRQNGSLHCASMQFPRGTINPKYLR